MKIFKQCYNYPMKCLTPELIKAIKFAGSIALTAQKHLTTETKKDGSIVTNGDLLVSSFLEKKLKELCPDYDVFSEENCTVIPKSNKVLVIDPIDGTESYSRKQDTWSILVGEMIDGKWTGGVVFQPTSEHLFFTYEQMGSNRAYFEHKKSVQEISAKGSGELSGYMSHKNYGEDVFFKKLGVTKVDHMFSAALKIMKVAEGTTDLYPNFRGACSLWDLVAPVAILEAAGGQMFYESPSIPSFENPRIPVNFCAVGQRVTTNPFKGE